MKNTIFLIIAISFALLISSCSNDVTKKEEKKLSKEQLDCCPSGGGILDNTFHYDNIHFTDSTREGSPFIVYNVGGRDILFFTSARKINGNKNVTRQGDLFYSTRAVAERSECWNKNWSAPKEVSTGNAEFDKWTKGAIAIYGNKAIISAERSINSNEPNSTIGTSYNLDLWELDFKDGIFSNPKQLPNNVNSEYWDSYPAFSPDGKVLYFTSNRPLGEDKRAGDFNIWACFRNEDSWSDAIPIAGLSTPSNEITPFWGTDGKFYFASDKSGNYDIYVCTEFKDLNGIKIPQNFINLNDYLNNDRFSQEKYKINTSSNEINPFVTPDCSGLFYASDKVGGVRDYDLFACKLPPPLYKLKVNVYESITLCGQNERRSYDNLTLCISDGTNSNTFFAKDTIKLLPNKNYTITICDDSYAECYNTNQINSKKLEVSTASLCDKNKVFIETIEIESKPITDNFFVGADNFVTGYWKPSTTENIQEMKIRAEDGFFDNKQYPAPYVRYNETPNNTSLVDKSFMDITDKINSYIKRYFNCLKNGIYQLRINIKGYTDRQRIRTGKYPDETFYNPARNWTVKQGDAMKDIQRGNIILSKMRAYHTFQTIEKMMSRNSQYLELKPQIIYDFEGMGVDFDAYRGKCHKDDCPEARKMEVTIDLGPECWLEQNRRIPFKVSYLPLLDKDEKDKSSKIDYSVIQPYPKKNIPKKECDEFYTEYAFNKKEEAQLVYDILQKYSNVKFNLLEEMSTSGVVKYKLRTEQVKDKKNEAQSEANSSKSALTDLETILKKANPNIKAEGCQMYVITFGIFISYDLARDFVEKLSELDITNLNIKECSDCFLSKNFSTGEDEYIKSFIVFAKGFDTKEKAEKQLSKWKVLLDQYEILNYMRVENEEWNYKKQE